MKRYQSRDKCHFEHIVDSCRNTFCAYLAKALGMAGHKPFPGQSAYVDARKTRDHADVLASMSDVMTKMRP